MEDRTYTNKELKKIIDTALRMQQKSPGPPVDPELQSIDDIAAIGSELGISRELILRAAAELDISQSHRGLARLLGGELKQIEHLDIDHVVSESDLGGLAASLPQITDLQGQGSVYGHRFLWQNVRTTDQIWSVSISLDNRDQSAVVQIENRNTAVAVGLFAGLIGSVGVGMGVGVGVGVGIGALGSALFAGVVPVVCLTASYLIARGLFSWISRNRRKKIRQIAAQISELLHTRPGVPEDTNRPPE